MIWVHCGHDNEAPLTLSIVARLLDHCDPDTILVTRSTGDKTLFGDMPLGVQSIALPTDTPVKARAFLDQWAPQSLLWIGGILRPTLLRAVKRSQIPSVLINARTAGLAARGSLWLPGATKSSVAAFGQVFTADGTTATRLVRGGVAPENVTVSGPILEDPVPLEHNQYELSVMSEALGTRPVWFAASVVEGETGHLTTAHLAASRKNHRLLLVVAPRDENHGLHMAQTMRDAGLKVGMRSNGDDPDPDHQVYIADLSGEMGLWYRLSPLTFMGGTLSAGGAASPYDPLLLGSAVIHGPRKAPHDARYARLAKIEACREIRSASELGVAVGNLISPDQSARIALAGWEEISRNAETINHLIDIAVNSEDRL